MVHAQRKGVLSWGRHQHRWFGKWHLYLGIIAGAIIAVVGLTGSILVFQDEIDVALNPDLFNISPRGHKLPLGELIETVRQRHPDLVFDYVLTGKPGNDELAYSFLNYKGLNEVFIDPYTAEIKGSRVYNSGFIGVVTKIHTSLLVPVAGKYIVGLSALCLLILTISGLRLWIPSKWNRLKEALGVRMTGSAKRLNYDLHNVLGIYSAPVISALSITGFCITFSTPVIALLFMLSGKSPQGVYQLLGARSALSKEVKVMSITDVVSVIQSQFPNGRIVRIGMPADSTGSYRVDIAYGSMPRSGRREMLLLDQYSGKVLLNSKRDFPGVGKAYLSWLTPIHYGDFGGLTTRVMALLGGLIPLVLFITGWIIWWPRFKKQRRSARQSPLRHEKIDRHVVRQRRSPLKYPDLTAFGRSVRLFRDGVKYATGSVLIVLILGALYGLPSLLVLRPPVFLLAIFTTLVLLNFVVALISWLVTSLLLLPFGRSAMTVNKYFSYSLAFALVFLVVYFAMRPLIELIFR